MYYNLESEFWYLTLPPPLALGAPLSQMKLFKPCKIFGELKFRA